MRARTRSRVCTHSWVRARAQVIWPEIRIAANACLRGHGAKLCSGRIVLRSQRKPLSERTKQQSGCSPCCAGMFSSWECAASSPRWSPPHREWSSVVWVSCNRADAGGFGQPGRSCPHVHLNEKKLWAKTGTMCPLRSRLHGVPARSSPCGPVRRRVWQRCAAWNAVHAVLPLKRVAQGFRLTHV